MNVHLLRRSDGRASGDAYAVFDTEEAATAAMAHDKQKLGNRWVDLFRSSKGELYSITALGGIMLPSASTSSSAPHATTSALGEDHSVVKMRGLPWNVSPKDIAAFLAPILVPEGGVHLMNGNNGRPSGIAYVELETEDDQKEAVAKDKQCIGGRYIDVFPCTQTELQARALSCALSPLRSSLRAPPCTLLPARSSLRAPPYARALREPHPLQAKSRAPPPPRLLIAAALRAPSRRG